MNTISNCSVIIPTMNRPASLKRTIEKMLSASACPAEIIIVDQTQDKSLQEQNKRLAIENSRNGILCEYVYQKEPSSTKARNKGMQYATKEILVFSDDDVDVTDTTFGELEKLFENTQIAMVAGLDSNMSLGNGNPIGYLFGMKSWRKRNVGHVTLSMLGRFPNDVQGIVNTEWAMGFFFAVRRSLICQWNLRFDEQLTSYAYAEDLDFTYTYFKYARAHGLRCVFCSKIIVDHLGSKEYRVPSQKTCYMYVINREYLSYKHNKSWRSRLATRWANIGMVVMNIRNPQRLKYYWQAQICCDRNRKSLKLGVMPDDIYEAI